MLKAGFSRLDVTPPFGADISGYFHRRLAKDILDPIYLNAVAVSNGEETLLLIAVDFIGIRRNYIEKIKAEITARTELPEKNIFVAALHQHTSCCLDDQRNTRLRDEAYKDVLIRRFGDAALLAIADLKPAKVGTAALEVAEPIAFVRRYFADDGKVYTNPSSKLKLTGRCAEADNTMRLVRFAREEGKDIALINFSTHPDVIGGEGFSADWPGFTRKFVEEDHPDVVSIFFTGCQGDSNHIDFFKPKEERMHGERYEHSAYMGRMVADAVNAAWDHTEEQSGDAIFAEEVIIYNRTNTEGIDEYDRYKAWYEDYEAGKLDPKPHITELAYASRIIKLRESAIFRPVPLTVIGFGNVALVGFGGEPFTAYGEAMRNIVPEKFVVCVVCANGYEGYLPTEEAFAQGGYEAKSSLFTPSLEQELFSAAKEMLKNK